MIDNRSGAEALMEEQLWRHVGGIITQSTITTPMSRARSLIYWGD
jgi:hypothetical protein